MLGNGGPFYLRIKNLRSLLPEGPIFHTIGFHGGLGNLISDNSQYNITKYNKNRTFVI